MIVMLIDEVSTVSGMNYQGIVGRVAGTKRFNSRLSEFFLFCMFFLIDGINTGHDSTDQCPDGDRKSENGIRHALSVLMKVNLV